MSQGDELEAEQQQAVLTAELRALRRDMAEQNKLLEEIVETMRLWLAAMPYQPLDPSK